MAALSSQVSALTTALAAKQDQLWAINSVSAASYTLVAADARRAVVTTGATVLLPSDAVAIPVGSLIPITQAGIALSVKAGTGATVEPTGLGLGVSLQGGTVLAFKRAANTWSLVGRITLL